MRIDFGFVVASLLFLGDIFWFNGLKLSQLGMVLLVFLIYKRNTIISKRVVSVALFVFVYNLLLNLFNIDQMLNLIIKFSLLIIILMCAFDIKRLTYGRLLSYYFSFSSFVVIIWWIQLVAFLISSFSPFNLEIIYDSSSWSDSGNLHWVGNFPRLNSLYSEPSYLGLFLLPLLAIKLRNAPPFRWLTVLIPIMMTFSLNVYIGLGLTILFNSNLSLKTVVLVVIGTFMTLMLGLDEYILHRTDVNSGYIDVTLLVYIFHIQTFLFEWKNILFGYGIDNYFLIFDSWRSSFVSSEILTIVKTIPDEELMLQGAPLLIVRLLVELGYAFFLIVGFAIRKYIFVKSYWIYALVGLSLRDGDYLRPFFLFFLIMHISNSIIRQKQINYERNNSVRTVQS